MPNALPGSPRWPTAAARPASPRPAASPLSSVSARSKARGFHSLEEDLSYSAARLCQVWPSRFPDTEAAEACALQPEILANRVYANRMGNGDEASGDGWRFRGRGLIQITGRTAYEQFARAMSMTLDQAVEHAATQAGAADSAAWFWSANQSERAGQYLVDRSHHPKNQRRHGRRGGTEPPVRGRAARHWSLICSHS